MKKIVAFLLIASFVVCCFSGCGPTPNPATDFQYTENDDGGITITKYIGTDTSVIIPDKIEGKFVTEIGNGAFEYGAESVDIVSVIIPSSVENIGSFSFCRSPSLKTVILKEGVKTIGKGAFINCTSLQSVVLPTSLTLINSEAFSLCTALKHITIPSDCLDAEKSWSVFSASGLENVTLAEGVKTIPLGAFASTSIEEITLPSTVKEIGWQAFYDCKNLEKVVLNEGLTHIENSAFMRVPKLTEITIPASMQELAYDAFVYSNNLEAVKFKGDAPRFPITMGVDSQPLHSDYTPEFTVYYHAGAQGFDAAEWNGLKKKIW